MTDDALAQFVDRFDEFSTWSGTKQVDYFAYFLMGPGGTESFSATDILRCFEKLSLKRYERTAPYLSGQVASKKGKFVKVQKGYRLERGARDAIDSVAGVEPKKVHVSKQLAGLVALVTDPYEASFLMEAITCLRVDANRAAVVMIWLLSIDHLQRHVFNDKAKLAEFNAAIVRHNDKRLKLVQTYDDFGEIKESRIIELLRSAGIITSDVRKILDERLGNRNTAGHPAAVTIDGHKATEITLDLIQNVLLKY